MLPAKLATAARRRPECPSVVEGGRTLTYGELAARVSAVASRLRESSGPVALWTSTLTGTTVGLLAALAADRMAVPLDTRQAPARILAVARESGIRTVLRDFPFDLDPALDEIDVSACTSVDGLSDLEREPMTGSFAYALSTSGSTGIPKRIRHRRGVLDAVGANFASAVGLRATDRLAVAASLSHDAVLVDIAAAITTSATMVRLDILDPRVSRRPGPWLDEHGVTVVHCVPTIGQRLIERMPSLPIADSPVRAWVFGGEVTTETILDGVADRTPSAQAYLLYGQTECSIVSIHHARSASDAGLIGRTVDGVECRLVPRDEGDLALQICGPLVSPDVPPVDPTDPAAWRFTGDLVRRDADGVRFVGREDDVVKMRGERLSRLDVERVLRRIPGVDAAAVTVMGPLGRQRVCALLEGPGADASLESVNSAVCAALGTWVSLNEVKAVDSLPTLPSGKLDRRGVSKLFEPGCSA